MDGVAIPSEQIKEPIIGAVDQSAANQVGGQANDEKAASNSPVPNQQDGKKPGAKQSTSFNRILKDQKVQPGQQNQPDQSDKKLPTDQENKPEEKPTKAEEEKNNEDATIADRLKGAQDLVKLQMDLGKPSKMTDALVGSTEYSEFYQEALDKSLADFRERHPELTMEGEVDENSADFLHSAEYVVFRTEVDEWLKDGVKEQVKNGNADDVIAAVMGVEKISDKFKKHKEQLINAVRAVTHMISEDFFTELIENTDLTTFFRFLMNPESFSSTYGGTGFHPDKEERSENVFTLDQFKGKLSGNKQVLREALEKSFKNTKMAEAGFKELQLEGESTDDSAVAEALFRHLLEELFNKEHEEKEEERWHVARAVLAEELFGDAAHDKHLSWEIGGFMKLLYNQKDPQKVHQYFV